MNNLLRSWTPLILLVSVLSLSGCKNGGGGITDPVEPPVEVPEITSSFENGETSFMPGEIQLINIDGTALTEDEYTAVLGNGAEVILYSYSEDVENKTLVFIVPEVASQDHELIFTLEDQEQTLKFNIKDYEVIEDPKVFVEEFSNQIATELDEVINQTQDQIVADVLRQKRDELSEHFEEFNTMSGEEQALIARILFNNLENVDGSAKAKEVMALAEQNTMTCSEAKNILTGHLETVRPTTAAFLGGVLLTGTTALAPVGIVAAGITAGAILVNLKPIIHSLGDFIEACFIKDEAFLSTGSNNKMNTSHKTADNVTTLEFTHNKTETLFVQANYDLDTGLSNILSELRHALEYMYSLLPDSWVDVISKENYEEVRTEDPSLYLISNISNDLIDASITVTSGQMDFILTYPKGVILDSDPSFTFELQDKSDNQETTLIEAELHPPLPSVFDRKFTIETDSLIIDTLKADYAADFIIETPPSNGTVTLDNVFTGEFTYQRDEGYTGEDSFTFSASNSTGDSEIGTVSVADYDPSKIPAAIQGNWEMTEEYGTEGGYAITILVINSEEIITIIYESYKECWEEPYYEMDPNNPGERDGDTYTYYSQDAFEYVTLSKEDGSLRMESAEDPSVFILIPESEKDINSLSPQCE